MDTQTGISKVRITTMFFDQMNLDMFKPTLLKDDATNTHRVVYRLVEEPKPPAAIELPNWLVEHLLYVWKLEHELNRTLDIIKAMKLIRIALPRLGLKEAKDVAESIREIHWRCTA